MKQAFELHFAKDGVANLAFDLPDEKVNKLSYEVLKELDEILDELKKRNDIKVLTITSKKPNIFIAGADIKGFEKAFKDTALGEKLIRFGHHVFNKIQDLPYPTVAVIDGACLGGGCELALACKYRVVTDNPKTSIGLPEVTLGIFPGWGGTQRLPRLIGLEQAVSMILSGKAINGQKAIKIGFADAIYPKEFLNSKLPEFIEEVSKESGERKILDKRCTGGFRKFLLEKNPIGRLILFSQAKKRGHEKYQRTLSITSNRSRFNRKNMVVTIINWIN